MGCRRSQNHAGIDEGKISFCFMIFIISIERIICTLCSVSSIKRSKYSEPVFLFSWVALNSFYFIAYKEKIIVKLILCLWRLVMNTHDLKLYFYLGSIFFFICCGDGASINLAGNPSVGGVATREVTGQVGRLNPGEIEPVVPEDCSVDRVRAVNVEGGTILTNIIRNNCSFRFFLTIGRTYTFEFLRDGQFIAMLAFSDRNTNFLDRTELTIPAGRAAINFGVVTFDDGFAFPGGGFNFNEFFNIDADNVFIF